MVAAISTDDHISRIQAYLDADFEKELFKAAVVNLNDISNVLRVNNFAFAMRELIGRVLSRMAPDTEIDKCSWFQPDSSSKTGITRAHRIRYAIHKGFASEYVLDHFGIDVERTVKCLVSQIDELSCHTHVNEKTFGIKDTENIIALEVLSSVSSFLEKIEECEDSVSTAVADEVSRTVVDEIMSETMSAIDILATHYYLGSVDVGDYKIEICPDRLLVAVNGVVEVTLQWGSNSDVRNDNGAEMEVSFPFSASIAAPLDNLNDFTLDGDVRIDTSAWNDADDFSEL